LIRWIQPVVLQAACYDSNFYMLLVRVERLFSHPNNMSQTQSCHEEWLNTTVAYESQATTEVG